MGWQFTSGRGSALLLRCWVSLVPPESTLEEVLLLSNEHYWWSSLVAQKPKHWLSPMFFRRTSGDSVAILHPDHCGLVCEGARCKTRWSRVPLYCYVGVLFISHLSPSTPSAHASHNESHTPEGTNHPQSVRCSGKPLPLTCRDGCHHHGADAVLGQPWEVLGQGII